MERLLLGIKMTLVKWALGVRREGLNKEGITLLVPHLVARESL